LPIFNSCSEYLLGFNLCSYNKQIVVNEMYLGKYLLLV
jgi:hypothetical protein